MLSSQISKLDVKWANILNKILQTSKSKTLLNFVEARYRETKVYPPVNNVFEALSLCPFDKVKCVILGQDPYHGPGQAHGLSFSVKRGVMKPPSLQNIFKECASDVNVRIPPHGCLEEWAQRGVLLLNAVLTVEDNKPNSHQGRGWEEVTDALVKAVSDGKENVVFMLWGIPAQKKGILVNSKKHHIITSSHPSPLGAAKTASPFLGSKCFSRCNTFLKSKGMEEIDWKISA
jgi:uracil-DNA glycosylase